MKNYPIEKYQFKTYTDKPSGTKVVVAISTYAGHIVRGVAKCSPEDKFDMTKGKELAAARCAKKIALRREVRAAKKLAEAKAALEAAEKKYDDMLIYSQDAWESVQIATGTIDELLKVF